MKALVSIKSTELIFSVISLLQEKSPKRTHSPVVCDKEKKQNKLWLKETLGFSPNTATGSQSNDMTSTPQDILRPQALQRFFSLDPHFSD